MVTWKEILRRGNAVVSVSVARLWAESAAVVNLDNSEGRRSLDLGTALNPVALKMEKKIDVFKKPF